MKKSIRLFILIALFFQVQCVYGSDTPEKVTSFQVVQRVQPGLDIMLVMDNSGSMKKNDPDFLASDVVARSLVDLGDDLYVGMVIFDAKARIALNLTPANNIVFNANIVSSLDKVNYNGLFSDTPAAIEMAIYELKNNGRKDAQKIIILMSDGFVDTGNKLEDLERARWLREDLAEEGARSGIRIFGVAFSDMADFSLFQILAGKTDGEYFRTYKVEDINAIFDRIKQVVSEKEAPLTAQAAGTGEPHAQVTGEEMPAREGVDTIEEGEAPVKETEDARAIGIPWAPLLAGILLLLVIFVIAMIHYRRSVKKDRRFTLPSDVSIPKAVLIDINNITGTKSFILEKRINMIGRDPNNDIVIAKDTISSFHAVIEYRDGSFYLEDQRSRNKTVLAGEELLPQSPRRLKSGDEVMFHIYIFKFFLPDTIPSGKTMIDFHAPSETVARRQQDSVAQEIPAIPKAILVDVKNITGEKTIHLKKRINRIGRGSGNEVEIREDSISGLHAVIEYRDGYFYLEDQRSKNKTTLGGVELEPHAPGKLKSGDEIVFDVYKFIFLLEYELPSGDTGEGTEQGKD
ncbi:MAG TPA: FHA domain-containing protein [Desulfatiglandales bacterium]|nr:FHA domain-containing protein [Desulfatiglandales bacterium]